MLACVRIGAIHSVVFGGFAAASLATRIDDARPKVMVTADAGMRGGKPVPYKHLVDEAMPPRAGIRRRTCSSSTAASTSDMPRTRGARPRLRDAAREARAARACRASGSSRASRRTSSTPPAPPASRRACSATPAATRSRSRRRCATSSACSPARRCSPPATSAGSSGIRTSSTGRCSTARRRSCTRGCRSGPIPSIWWKIVAETRRKTMFSSPTAIRVLKKQDPAYMRQHDLSSLRYLFLAGEPLDEPTARWVSDALGGVAIVDNYWQTESGWPILSAQPGSRTRRASSAVPSFPAAGYDVRLLKDGTGEDAQAGEKGVLAIVPPLPPGCMTTVWGDDERFVSTYFKTFPGRARVLDVRLGHARRGRLLLRARAAPTTSSTSRAIAWARARSRRRCRRTRASPRSRWSASPIRSRARCPVAFAVVKDPARVATAEGVAVDAQGSDGHGGPRAGRDRASRAPCIS